MNSHFHILEFHKILGMLSELAANDITREMIQKISPCSDLVDARTELEKTNDNNKNKTVSSFFISQSSAPKYPLAKISPTNNALS